MSEYIVNVMISFMPAFVAGVGLVFLATVALSVIPMTAERSKIVRTTVVKLVAAIWALGLVVALVSPSNTYKLEPHNKQALNQKIEQQQLNRTSSGVIQDRTRQPAKTNEERKKDFDELTTYQRSE